MKRYKYDFYGLLFLSLFSHHSQFWSGHLFNRIYRKRLIMKIPRILVVPIWVAMVAALATLVGFIAHWLGAYNPTAWGAFTLFGIMGGFILYIGFRQLYWLLTGKGDYEGGGLPKLWKKIFKK